jgi:IS30 family transposase
MKGVPHIPWSEDERQELRRLCENGMQRVAIARHLGRSVHSVARQLAYLGLRTAPHAPGKRQRTAHKAGRTTLPALSSLQQE